MCTDTESLARRCHTVKTRTLLGRPDPAVATGPRGVYVGHHLRLEGVHPRELHLGANALEELDPERPVVEVAGEIEEVGFDPVLVLPEGRTIAHVDDGVGVTVFPRGAGDVDAGREHERTVGLEI